MARGAGRKTRAAGTFGTVHKLPSGRYRALYYGPDGKRRAAPTTFTAATDARGWLATVQAEIIRKAWTPPETEQARTSRVTLAEYAEHWLANRDLKDRTRAHYRSLLDRHILPVLGDTPLPSITVDDVQAWYADVANGRPTLRSHAYGLLRTILGTAVTERRAEYNPCHVRGAGRTKPVRQIRPASLDELTTLTDALPARYRLMALLAAWCALRFGELTELRRSDVETRDDVTVLRVRRAVVRVNGGKQVTSPKSDAGARDVTVPPHLAPMLGEHLAEHVAGGDDALLFPSASGEHLAESTLRRHFHKARAAAGRPDLRFHDLRHTGAVLVARTGATLAELMARLGHASPQAAMRYQHASADRDALIAQRLSALAEGKTA